jgi:hypothetical protein
MREDDVERILGIDIVHKLRVVTDGIMENVEASLSSLRQAHDALHDDMKRYFKKQILIKVAFGEPFTGRDCRAT